MSRDLGTNTQESLGAGGEVRFVIILEGKQG